MTPAVQHVTVILALGVLLLDVLIVLGFLSLFLLRDVSVIKTIFRFVSKYAVLLGFLITVGAALASLYYSNIVGFAPCELCWWIRIFTYPQAFIYGLALYRQKKGRETDFALSSSLLLSIVGGFIALFNYYGQSFNPSALSACGASGVSCSTIYFNEFGFITIPFMALTAFVATILIVIIRRRS